MGNSRNKPTDTNSWFLIGLIVVLLLLTIFAGRFFTSENKLKLIFDHKQTLSTLIAIYNNDNVITQAAVLILNTDTNRVASVSILPQTYISFLKNGKSTFMVVADTLKNDISKEEIKNGTSKLIGAPINYYLFMKEENFIRYVDLIGGVEVYTDEISIPEKNIYYPSGMITLDGDKAEEFLNLEITGENEYEPLKRIEVFVRSLLTIKEDFLEAFNENVITNYVYPLFTTNLSVNDSLIFYKEIKKRFSSGITDYSRYFVGIIVYCDKDTNEDEVIYLPKKSGNWVKGEVKDALTNLAKKESKEIGNRITVQILNGTEIVGFANRSRQYLESFGFDVLETGNADNSDYKNTVILVRNSEQKALKLADLIKCKRIMKMDTTTNNDDKIDVTLILGRDFDGRTVK